MNRVKEKLKNKKMILILYHAILTIKYDIIRYFSVIYWVFPIQNNKIVVDSYFGKGYGDNPKYIIQNMLGNKEIQIVWLVRNIDKNMPTSIKQVKANSFKALYELATSKVWVDNSRKNFVPIKRREQFYLQTWHGAIALKYVEKDAVNFLSKYYEHIAKRDSKNCNLMITGSEFGEQLIKQSFWYDGKVSVTGTPRNDILLETGKINPSFRKKYGISIDSKLILYAPTFRKKENLDLADFEIKRMLDAFENKFGKSCNLLIRLHPIDSKKRIPNYDNRIINVSNYPDMQVLLYESDVLITDYSSSMFDALIGKKICLLYANDIASYLKNDRPMYFDIKNLPFPLAQNSEELIKIINNFDLKQYSAHTSKFSKDLGIYEDGHASQRISELLEAILK